jgi:hypothetical protein
MNAQELAAALAASFAPDQVKFKPAVVSGSRALALPYVDARVIQDRLDDVLGVAGWQDDYEFLPDGSVVCRLRCKLGEEWIVKVDVGGPSEQPDGGDRLKAAVSDALKRAAVKFGVGRYLYRLPAQWADYDPQRKQFVRQPRLPAVAPQAPSAPSTNGKHVSKAPEPKNGAQLSTWLDNLDACSMAHAGTQAGWLRAECVRLAGTTENIERWPTATVNAVVQVGKALAAKLRQAK